MFVCHLLFLSRCMEPEGLWQRLVAAPQDRRPIFLPLYPFPTPARSYWRHGGGITTSPSPQIRRKALPKQRKEQRKGEKIVHQSGLLHPYSSVPSGVGSEVYGTSESGVNDERSDKKGRRCRIIVVVPMAELRRETRFILRHSRDINVFHVN